MAKQNNTTTTTPAVTAVTVAPVRGAVTMARWGACLGKQGGQPTMPAAIKALALQTVIVCNVANNPKRNKQNVFVYPFASANGVAGIAPGNTCTLAQYVAALTKAGGGALTQAAGHVAWDLNHGFISLASAAQAPAPVAQAA